MGKIVKKYVCGPIQTNCYFVIDEKTANTLIIDPGPGSDRLLDLPLENGWHMKAVLLTHAHWDHIEHAADFHDKFSIPRIILDKEKETLSDPAINVSEDLTGQGRTYEADRFVRDGDIIDEWGFRIKVYALPGHTPGGAGWYMPDDGILFSGDSLFQGSTGRTDFPGGSMSDLIRSLNKMIAELPVETRVYPGHGPETDIASEKMYNPFLTDIFNN